MRTPIARVAVAPVVLTLACGSNPGLTTQVSSSLASLADPINDDDDDSSADTQDPATSAPTSAPTSSSSDPTTDPTNDPTPATVPMSASDPTTAGDTTAPPGETGGTTTTPGETGDTTNVDTGPTCGGGCNNPPGPCYDSPGECIDGRCDYSPSASNKSCSDGDPCTDNDKCNGAGACAGAANTCPDPPHANAGACQNGVCPYTCIAPYEDCDGEAANGCEVPVGVAHKCDVLGLNDNGCWTAYCGSSNNPKAVNFGDYFCVDCATCREPMAGQVQYCNHATGSFYPAEPGMCDVAYENKVCAP